MKIRSKTGSTVKHPVAFSNYFIYYICMEDHTGEKIGEGLKRIGAMTEEQVNEVLELQKNGDKRLFGEIAISLGYIDDEAIRKYIESKGN